MTDAPSVTYATVVGGEVAVVAATVVWVVMSEVGAVVICGACDVELDDEEDESSSSPPHAPSRRIPAATAAIESIGARRRRRDIGDEEVASGPHARVTCAKLVQKDLHVQARRFSSNFGVDRNQQVIDVVDDI